MSSEIKCNLSTPLLSLTRSMSKTETLLILEDLTLHSPGPHQLQAAMLTSNMVSKLQLVQPLTSHLSQRTSGVRLPPTSTDGEFLLVLNSKELTSPTQGLKSMQTMEMQTLTSTLKPTQEVDLVSTE